MRRVVPVMALFLFLSTAFSLDAVKLFPPDLNRSGTLMTALQKRSSATRYGAKELSVRDLSDLLWAANGVNRPPSGKRTAPSALNAQDISVFVFTARGAWLYDHKKTELTPAAEGDHRGLLAGGQGGVAKAPVVLLLVSDTSRFPFGDRNRKLQWGAMDAGIVSQNISLFCASAGLLTRVRGTMDAKKLSEILKLKGDQVPMLNHPVSYGE